jgi:hypothetical protein
MGQQLPCSEPDCHETVDYERESVPGVGEMAMKDFHTEQGGTKRVYLTCKAGHTHVYVVSA